MAIFAENLQIVLLQKLRVRVDRKEVKLPYFNLGAVNIVTTGYNIIVSKVSIIINRNHAAILHGNSPRSGARAAPPGAAHL